VMSFAKLAPFLNISFGESGVTGFLPVRATGVIPSA